ncbi:MAG TPA: hypothetical protein VMT03_02695 [Polyangia bacterium]|nr:hypothetical protein [Polyangia bacterium]
MSNSIQPISPQLSSQEPRLAVAGTRPRQTQPPATPFRDVLTGGVSLLLSGAEVATHVVAGPVMAAAVHGARVEATSALAGTSNASSTGGSTGSTDLSSVQSIMQDGQASNMQLLALQEQIQNESQQFSTLSNVMRARYDTAKAAVSNIRA